MAAAVAAAAAAAQGIRNGAGAGAAKAWQCWQGIRVRTMSVKQRARAAPPGMRADGLVSARAELRHRHAPP